MIKRFIYVILILIFCATCLNKALAADEIYYPYPIIFVHGLDADITTWDVAKSKLDLYFKDQSGCKYLYQDSEYDYFPWCDYREQNKGDIARIATTFLKNSIDLAVSSFPPQVPGDKRKVILVTHSMGGLITRSLLKQLPEYQNKIEKVIFVGTPHMGSPYASVVWLLNKIRKEILTPAYDDYATFYAQNAGSRFRFIDNSSVLQITGLPVEVCNNLTMKLGQEKLKINIALLMPDWILNVTDSTALEQLRSNTYVGFEKIISYFPLPNEVPGITIGEVRLNGAIIGDDTFLGKSRNNLSVPNNFKVVRGINPFPVVQEALEWGILDLYRFNDNFTFSDGFSLKDTMTTGDGIVPLLSQERVNDETIADNAIVAFHALEPQHSDLPRIILDCIDLPPEVERVRVIAEDETQRGYATPYYVCVKVKEYLLADVVVEEMRLDGRGIIPGTQYNIYGDNFQQSNYRPYDEAGKEGFEQPKDFLRKRNGPKIKKPDGGEGYIELEPGEFYFKVNITYGKHELYIKLRNPSDKTTEVTAYVSKPKTYDLRSNTWLYGLDGQGTRKLAGYINVPPLEEEMWFYFGDGSMRYRMADFCEIHFKLEGYLTNQYKINITIFDDTGNVIRRIINGMSVTLGGGPDTYYGEFESFIRWDGKNDSGQPVMPNKSYRIQLDVLPVDDTFITPKENDFIQIVSAGNKDYYGSLGSDLIYADPSFVQFSRDDADKAKVAQLISEQMQASGPVNTIIDITPRLNDALTAKIAVPTPNSLVRADVPIFGQAYGKEFKEYILEYGEGEAPEEWKLIARSTTPRIENTYIREIEEANNTIKGNLGTWQTGLTEYEHNNTKYPMDLNGIYTLRLIAIDQYGNCSEDKVTVEVGRIISNVYGGTAESPDKQVKIEFSEHSLRDDFLVVGINKAVDSIQSTVNSNTNDKHQINIYEIKPYDEKLLRPAKISITCLDKDTSDLGIYELNKTTNQWEYLATSIENDQLTAYIDKIGHYYAVMPILSELATNDRRPATGDWRLTTGNRGYIYRKQTLLNITASPGTKIEDITINGKSCLKITADDEQGLFGVKLIDQPIKLNQCGRLSFDYNIAPDIKIDLMVKANNKWYNIGLTDELKSYQRTNMKYIGAIENIKADNQWHYAEFNLKQALDKFTNYDQIEEIAVADWDSSGYMMLAPGQNPKGRHFYLANIDVEPAARDRVQPAPSNVEGGTGAWFIGIEDNDSGEFSDERKAKEDYYVGQPYDEFRKAITPENPVTNIHFNLTKRQAKAYYRLILRAISVDTTTKGYVRFAVLLNNEKIKEYNLSYWQGQKIELPVHNYLRKGENTITLQYLSGGNWISWDWAGMTKE